MIALPILAAALMDELHQGDGGLYDRAYNLSGEGLPGVWSMCVSLAQAGLREMGTSWESDEREFIDDLQDIWEIAFELADGGPRPDGFADSWRELKNRNAPKQQL